MSWKVQYRKKYSGTIVCVNRDLFIRRKKKAAKCFELISILLSDSLSDSVFKRMEKTPPDRQRIPSFVDEVLNSAGTFLCRANMQQKLKVTQTPKSNAT